MSAIRIRITDPTTLPTPPAGTVYWGQDANGFWLVAETGPIQRFNTATEVNTAIEDNVANNLTTNSATMALSAAQGVVIQNELNSLNDRLDFLEFRPFATRNDPLLHQPTTLQPYLTLNATIPEAGVYRLNMTHRFSINSTTVNFESHIEFGGNFFIITHVEMQDAAGAGILVNNTTGGMTNTGTDNFKTLSGFTHFTLPAGPASFVLEFRGQTANQEATIYEADMFLERVQ